MPSFSKTFSDALARARTAVRKPTTDYYVRVALTDKEHDHLHFHAEHLDCTVGDLVENAIRLYLRGRLGQSHEDMVKELVAVIRKAA